MQSETAILMARHTELRRAVSHTRNPWAIYNHHGWSRDFRRYERRLLKHLQRMILRGQGEGAPMGVAVVLQFGQILEPFVVGGPNSTWV